MNGEHLNEEKLRGFLSARVTSRVSDIGKELMDFRAKTQQSAQEIIDRIGSVVSDIENDLLQEFRQVTSEREQELRSQLETEIRAGLDAQVQNKLHDEFENQISGAKAAVLEAEQQRYQSKLEVLSGALREISQQQTQVEVLNCFLDKAAIFAPRVAFFVIKTGNIVGWQARGFEGDFTNDSIKSLLFPADTDSLFKQVAESRIAFRGTPAGHPEATEVVSKLGPIAPDQICAIPLVVRDKAVAILYADTGMTPEASIDWRPLELLMTGVGLTVELSSARTKLGIKPTEAPPAKVPASAATAAQAEMSPPPEPAPHYEEPEPAPEPKHEEEAREVPREHEPAMSEPAPEPEAHEVAAFESAAIPPAEAVPQVAPVSWTPSVIESLSEAEQKLHNDARRFARLLVSEIKLYNEQKVQEGRRDKNLYELLRDDIDKSREMYDKRVSPEVAAKVDYFYEEVVRILADNQVSALGRDCPGPSVLN